ncbi:MAG TPA: universal stress protein [Sphingobacteriaceae bacterium]
MKTILVPIDFSPLSRAASEYASYFAKITGAEVHLLHTFLEIPVSIEPPVPEMISGGQIQTEYESLINKEIEFLKEKYLVNVQGYAVSGFKQSKINDVCEKLNADLIVMGAGNTALGSIRNSKVPVMVIPEQASFKPVKHIVLAVDFVEITNPACFDLLSEIVEKFDAMLQVVHVKKKSLEAGLEEIGKLQLAMLLSKVTYWYQQIEAEGVEEGIKEFIQSHPADLLVMVAHRHNIFQRIFGTIHTSAITYETNLPLLVLEDK